jgi:ubiquinone/menaquinone biosynthesis C-methylase UbiE
MTGRVSPQTPSRNHESGSFFWLEHVIRRSTGQKVIDFIAFPLRALTLHAGIDKWGLTSLASERYEYVSGYVKGRCLDVGCGPHNRFVKNFLNGAGIGIDVYKYDGLDDENIVEDISKFPFADGSFESVTFIANLNHVPKQLRDVELAEAFRVLKPGGNIIITMGRPIVEILVHQFVAISDKLFRTNFDLDNERGMTEDEDYYVTPEEIYERLGKAGFQNLQRRLFWTQWGLNQLFAGWKI